MRTKIFSTLSDKLAKKFSPHYIELKAKRSPLESVSYDLEEKVDAFVHANTLYTPSDFLLQGDSGSGKSTFVYHWLTKWKLAASNNYELPIPILVDRLYRERDVTRWLRHTLLEDYKLNDIEYKEFCGSAFFVVVDGFDELVRFDEEGILTPSNLREVAGLDSCGDGIYRPKLLITCRTHFLREQAAYAKYFGAHADDTESHYIAPFDDKQVDAYLEYHIKDYDEESKKRYRMWFSELPHLKELASNPLLLAMVLEILPDLHARRLGQGAIKSRLKPIKRMEIFDLYVKKWFLREEGRFNLIKSDGDVSVELDRTGHDFLNYAQRLAWEMTVNRITQVKYLACNPKEEDGCGADQVLWDSYLADRAEVFGSRLAALIHRVDDGFYAFLHADFRDYLSAEYLIAALGLRKAEFDCGLAHPFNSVFLAKADRAVLKFMAEKLSLGDAHTVSFLLSIVRRSSSEMGYEKASSNALTILNYARYSFSNSNLSNIKVPYADLSEAILYQAVLSGADLRYVILDRANLYGADLTRANLTGCQSDHQKIWSSANKLLFNLDYHPKAHQLVILGCCTNPIELLNLNNYTSESPYGLDNGLVYLRALKLSPDGVWLVAATQKLPMEVYSYFGDEVDLRMIIHDPSKPLRFLDRSSGIMYKLIGHEGEVLDMSFVADKLLSLGDDGTLRLWEMKPPFASSLIETNIDWKVIKCHDTGYCVALSEVGVIAIYIVEHIGKTLPKLIRAESLPIIEPVESYDLSANKEIILLSRENRIYILFLELGNWKLRELYALQLDPKFNPDRIRWIDENYSFLLADNKRWRYVALHSQRIRMEGEWSEPISEFVYVPEEEKLYAASLSASVLKIELKHGHESIVSLGANFASMYNLVVDSEEGLIITRDQEGYIYLIDSVDGEFLIRSKGPVPQAYDIFKINNNEKTLSIKNTKNWFVYSYSSGRFILKGHQRLNSNPIEESFDYVVDPTIHYAVQFIDSNMMVVIDLFNRQSMGLLNLPEYSYTVLKYIPLPLFLGNYGLVQLSSLVKVLFLIVNNDYPYYLILLTMSAYVRDIEQLIYLSIFSKKNELVDHGSYLEYFLHYRYAEKRMTLFGLNKQLKNAFDDYVKTIKLCLWEFKEFDELIINNYNPIKYFFFAITPFTLTKTAWAVFQKRLTSERLKIFPRIAFEQNNQLLVMSTPGPYSHFMSYAEANFTLMLCHLRKYSCSLLSSSHKAPISMLKMSADGSLLCSVDFSGSMMLWLWDSNVQSFIAISEVIETKSDYPIQVIEFSHDNNWVIASSHRRVLVLDTKSVFLTANITVPNFDIVHLAWDRDAVVMADARGSLTRWALNPNYNGVNQFMKLAWQIGSTVSFESIRFSDDDGVKEKLALLEHSKPGNKINYQTWPHWPPSLDKWYELFLLFGPSLKIKEMVSLGSFRLASMDDDLSDKLIFLSVPWILLAFFTKDLQAYKISAALYLLGKYSQWAELYSLSSDLSSHTSLPLSFYNKHTVITMALSAEDYFSQFCLIPLVLDECISGMLLGTNVKYFDLAVISSLVALRRGVVSIAEMSSFYPGFDGLNRVARYFIKFLLVYDGRNPQEKVKVNRDLLMGALSIFLLGLFQHLRNSLSDKSNLKADLLSGKTASPSVKISPKVGESSVLAESSKQGLDRKLAELTNPYGVGLLLAGSIVYAVNHFTPLRIRVISNVMKNFIARWVRMPTAVEFFFIDTGLGVIGCITSKLISYAKSRPAYIFHYSNVISASSLLKKLKFSSETLNQEPSTVRTQESSNFSVEVSDKQLPCYYSPGKTNIVHSFGAQPHNALLAGCKEPEAWSPYSLFLMRQSVRQAGFCFMDGFISGFSAKITVIPPLARQLIYDIGHSSLQYCQGSSLVLSLTLVTLKILLMKGGMNRTASFCIVLVSQLLYTIRGNERNFNEQVLVILTLLLMGTVTEICGRALGGVAGHKLNIGLQSWPGFFFARTQARSNEAVPAASEFRREARGRA